MGENNEKYFTVKVIWLPLAVAFILAIFAYGKYTEKVNQLEKVAEQTKKNTELIIELKADIKYIRNTVSRIDDKSKPD